jgi:O-antigen ligase/tetratricopeptide (TPR) repeat protein
VKENQNNIDIIDTPLSRFDKVIEWLLISLLAFMPFAFGAVEAWSEQVVIILAALISICFLLKLVFEKNTRLIWSWSYVPVALFTIIAIIQLIPLPTSLVSTISPGTAETKAELLGDLPDSEAILRAMTVSFYPNATKHDLRLFIAVIAVFVVVLNTYRRPDQIKRLLAAIAIIGGAIALLALVQDLFGNGKIYWFIPAGGDKAHSGTFINHSHYGQFMNLSIGAALGLIMVKLHEAFTTKKVSPAFVFEYLSSSNAKVIWLLVAMIILGAATVFVSLTRGGMVSMLIAAGFTTLILSSRRSLRGRSWIMLLLALGAFICVLYIGFDAVYNRLATLQELHQYEGRWQIVRDLSVSFKRFPVLGTGLGTHEVVYPMFDRSTTPTLASHAENEYAQAAEETGLIGLGILIVFGLLVWLSYIRNVRSSHTPVRSAGYGLGFGLLAIMIHSLSDFGQHLPANAFLSGISCALLVGLAHIKQKNNPTIQLSTPVRGLRGLRIVVLLCVSGVWTWAALGANNARLAEASWKKTLAVEKNLSGSDVNPGDEEYINLISNAVAAVNYQPDNVKYQHGLNVYRWWSISRTTDPNTGEIIMPEQALVFVQRIVDELQNARLLCPTYGATYCVVGQLEKFILNNPNGSERIRKGYQLAPCDPTACFVAGLLDAEEQKIESSFDKFSRAIELDGRFFHSIADIYVNHVDRPDLAVAIAGDDSSKLSYVANAIAEMKEHKDIVEKAQIRVVEILKQKCSSPDAPASALASLANICRKENDTEAAIEHYRRALALEYGQVQWRYTLARLLAENDRVPEAIHEARICLRLRPQFEAAKSLIEELSVLPGAEAEENYSP